MRVKLDENVPATVQDLIADAGHEVDTVVGKNLGGATDEQALLAAAQADRLLFTLDRGFGSLVRRLAPHAGVVVLRLLDQRVANVEAVVAKLLTRYRLEQLAGCLVIVHLDHVRIRHPSATSEDDS